MCIYTYIIYMYIYIHIYLLPEDDLWISNLLVDVGVPGPS